MLDFTVEHSGKTLDRLWQYINHSTACLGGQHPRRKALATDAKRRLTMDYKACSYQRKIGGSVLATDTKNYIYTNFLTSFNDFNLRSTENSENSFNLKVENLGYGITLIYCLYNKKPLFLS